MRKGIYLSVIGICGLAGCAKRHDSVPYEIIDATYIHKYGATVPEHDWNSRGGHGTVMTTLSNGVIVSNCYSNGILEGDTTYTFPHSSTMQKVESYSRGNLFKSIEFYPHGSPQQEIHYHENGGKDLTVWYENGNPKSIETYDQSGLLVSGEYFDLNHQKDSSINAGEGSRNVRDHYGQMLSKETVQGGKMVSRTLYHQNGMPKEVIPFHNDVIEGQRKSYLPGGEPNTIEEWSNGKQNGMTVVYQNGEKVAEIPYKAGFKNGVERHFRDENTVVEEITWSNDQLHGPSTKYVGKASTTQWYFLGQPVSKGNFDAMSGPLSGT